MSATHQSSNREVTRLRAARTTRVESESETQLGLGSGPSGFRGRRDEEGRLYDPPREASRADAGNRQPRAVSGRIGASKPARDANGRMIEVQGFSVEEMGRIKEADKALHVVYALQETVRSGVSRLYAELATFNPFPALGASRMGQWVRSGFGLMKTPQASENEEREDIQSKISLIVSKAKNIHTNKIADAESKMREEFKGRTFLATGDTPRLLKHVSIPAGKTHVPYEKLQQDLRSYGVGGTRIKVSCPSDERTVVHRKRPDGSWESLELSWRQPGKVDIIRNGIKEAHLYNEDALKAAKLFAEGHKVCFNRKKVDPNTVWQVI